MSFFSMWRVYTVSNVSLALLQFNTDVIKKLI